MTFSTISGFRERGKALDRDAEANRHPDHRHKLSAPIRDGGRTAGMDALAVRGATRLGKTGEIVVDVTAQTFGEFLPGGLGDLDRRLGERLQRPALECGCTGIPSPHHRAPRRVTGGHSGEFRAVGPIVLEDRVVDGGWIDPAG